jgi:hypothetical protein
MFETPGVLAWATGTMIGLRKDTKRIAMMAKAVFLE